MTTKIPRLEDGTIPWNLSYLRKEVARWEDPKPFRTYLRLSHFEYGRCGNCLVRAVFEGWVPHSDGRSTVFQQVKMPVKYYEEIFKTPVEGSYGSYWGRWIFFRRGKYTGIRLAKDDE